MKLPAIVNVYVSEWVWLGWVNFRHGALKGIVFWFHGKQILKILKGFCYFLDFQDGN